VTEKTDEEAIENDTGTEETIASVVSDGDQDRLITEHRDATTKATRTRQAETTEQESEKTDTEGEVTETSANGTEIEARAEETMETGPLDAIVIYSMIEEVAEETVVIEAGGMVAEKIATSLPRKQEAARRAHHHRPKRESPHQI
jgi:hypothetical protein